MKKDSLGNLEYQIDVTARLEKERVKSNESYAIKLVEKIVFGLIYLVLVAFAGAIIALVIK